MDRVLVAARLHTVRPLLALGMPWLVVACAFAVNAVFFGVTAISEADGASTGGLLALYFTVLALHVQAMTQLLPFGMGMGLSRRAFYLGSALAAAVQALGYGILLTALAALERATGGFGLGIRFWQPSPLDVSNPVLQVLVYGVLLLAFAAVGAGLGIAFKRWGPLGMYALAIGFAVALIGTLMLIGWLDAWATVGQWFGERSQLTLVLGVPLAFALVVGGLSWLGLRRTVP